MADDEEDDAKDDAMDFIPILLPPTRSPCPFRFDTYLLKFVTQLISGKAYNVFGMIYLNQKEYEKAIECLNKSIINYVKTNNSDEISNVYHNIGTVFIAQKRLNKATEYLNKSISIRKKNKGSIDKINKSYKVLSDLYYEKGDIKNALNYLKNYSNYRDSNFVIQSSNHFYIIT